MLTPFWTTYKVKIFYQKSIFKKLFLCKYEKIEQIYFYTYMMENLRVEVRQQYGCLLKRVNKNKIEYNF